MRAYEEPDWLLDRLVQTPSPEADLSSLGWIGGPGFDF